MRTVCHKLSMFGALVALLVVGVAVGVTPAATAAPRSRVHHVRVHHRWREPFVPQCPPNAYACPAVGRHTVRHEWLPFQCQPMVCMFVTPPMLPSSLRRSLF